MLSDPLAPNEPAPLPSYHRWWMVVLSPWLIVGLIYWATRYIGQDPHHMEPKVEAVRKTVAIRDTLFAFDRKYGAFPDSATAEKVRRDFRSSLRLGTQSSNESFRQLIAAGLVDESVFAIQSKHTRKPDGKIAGDEALEAGECNYAYLVGGDDGSPEADFRPVIFGPVIPGTREFDREALNGDFVIMYANGAVQTIGIRKDGKIPFGGGAVVDPAKPEWKGKPLTIAWPE